MSAQPTGLQILVKIMNLCLFIFSPRKVTNARWADIVTDSSWRATDFLKNQMFRVYLRFSAKYKFHPQQMLLNAYRNMDPVESLAARMAALGTGEYYKALTPFTGSAVAANFAADLSMHRDSENLAGVMNTFTSLAAATSEENGSLATQLMWSGLSREIEVEDDGDWESFRQQLRQMSPDSKMDPKSDLQSILPLAVSYRGKEETFITKVSISKRGAGASEDVTEEAEITEKVTRTMDFLDDRRWDQVKRGARVYAELKKYKKCCLWVDRLVMLGRDKDERARIYSTLNWSEFGVYPYVVMPSIRLYDPIEVEFGTDFWRKVESTLAVAGKGLICDDYMIRKYDGAIYYDGSIYKRMGNGMMMLGGSSTYLRSTILALATMIMTDGVTISKSNEDKRTISSIVYWKSWAIRCLSKEAFAHAPAVPVPNDPPTVDLSVFRFLTAWEFALCRCVELTGSSYLDMSYQRAMSWRKSSSWSGISEWIGMVSEAYKMDKDNEQLVLSYLAQGVKIKMFAAPSGHTVARLTLKNGIEAPMKSLVVETSRFSTIHEGHVLAVADATGLGANRIMPWYLRQVPNPDGDQKVEITNGEVVYSYKNMRLEFVFNIWFKWIGIVIGHCLMLFFSFGLWIFIVALYVAYKIWKWPWADFNDVGEALFDNVLLDSLYGSGIKSIYRRVRTTGYRDIAWT